MIQKKVCCISIISNIQYTFYRDVIVVQIKQKYCNIGKISQKNKTFYKHILFENRCKIKITDNRYAILENS